jgi:predicted DNA-binding protein
MSISANNDRLTVIIPKYIKEELKKLADKENRSVSNYVVNLLEKHVKENRDPNMLYIDINVED